MRLTRRSVLRNGAAFTALSTLGRPSIARAEAKTAVVPTGFLLLRVDELASGLGPAVQPAEETRHLLESLRLQLEHRTGARMLGR